MAWTENGGERDGTVAAAVDSDRPKGLPPSDAFIVADGEPSKELLPPPLSSILRSSNKFTEALVLYESVLARDGDKSVEALIGKGICLQTQKMLPQAFESFVDAILLEPRNAVALTHCGLLYKKGGHFPEAVESYQNALKADPSDKPATECLAITDLGTNLKLAGNTDEGIQMYLEALK